MVFLIFFQIKVEFVKLKTEVSRRLFIKRQPSGTSSDNERQGMVHRVTTSDNEWYNEWQRMTASDNERQQVVQQITSSDNE